MAEKVTGPADSKASEARVSNGDPADGSPLEARLYSAEDLNTNAQETLGAGSGSSGAEALARQADGEPGSNTGDIGLGELSSGTDALDAVETTSSDDDFLTGLNQQSGNPSSPGEETRSPFAAR